MLRGSPASDSATSAPAIAPTVVQNGNSPRRALWALAPLIFLGLVAVGSRVFTASSAGRAALLSPSEAQEPVKSERVDAVTQKQLEAVVTGQLDALRHKDWAKALKFADASLQEQWNEDSFRKMIETSGFAIMPDSTKQECRKAQQASTVTTMLVTVRTPKGDASGFVYRMVRENDGWHIAACTHALDPTIAAMPPIHQTGMALNTP